MKHESTEFFIIILENPFGNIQLGNASMSVITIFDDDGKHYKDLIKYDQIIIMLTNIEINILLELSYCIYSPVIELFQILYTVNCLLIVVVSLFFSYSIAPLWWPLLPSSYPLHTNLSACEETLFTLKFEIEPNFIFND